MSPRQPRRPQQSQMDQAQQAYLQAVMYRSMIAAAGDSSVGDTSAGSVIPGEYINGYHNPNPSMPAPTVEQPSLTPVHFKEPEPNPVNSGWYDLVTPPTCQGCLALEDKRNKEWLCSGCRTTFRSKYEANRHIETAGMEVRCRYCDRPVGRAGIHGGAHCRRRIPRMKNPRAVQPPADRHSADGWWSNRNFSTHCPVCSEVASRLPRQQSFVNPPSCELSCSCRNTAVAVDGSTM